MNVFLTSLRQMHHVERCFPVWHGLFTHILLHHEYHISNLEQGWWRCCIELCFTMSNVRPDAANAGSCCSPCQHALPLWPWTLSIVCGHHILSTLSPVGGHGVPYIIVTNLYQETNHYINLGCFSLHLIRFDFDLIYFLWFTSLGIISFFLCKVLRWNITSFTRNLSTFLM